MKVKCIEDSATNWIGSLGDIGYTPQTVFDLGIDQVYIVYSMCLHKNILLYLLDSGNGHPAWYPSILFEVLDGRIPSSWHFAYLGRDISNEIKAIWGYAELVNDDGHFDAISEMDKQAIKIFEERRLPIEAEA